MENETPAQPTETQTPPPTQEVTEKATGGVTVNVEEFKNDTGKEIDYTKLIKDFGCHPIDEALLERFEQVTGHEPHIFLKRGNFLTF